MNTLRKRDVAYRARYDDIVERCRAIAHRLVPDIAVLIARGGAGTQHSINEIGTVEGSPW